MHRLQPAQASAGTDSPGAAGWCTGTDPWGSGSVVAITPSTTQEPAPGA